MQVLYCLHVHGEIEDTLVLETSGEIRGSASLPECTRKLLSELKLSGGRYCCEAQPFRAKEMNLTMVGRVHCLPHLKSLLAKIETSIYYMFV